MSYRVKKGDLVAVVSGDDRGKRGRVLKVIHEQDRVIVEGVNLVFKHLRRSQKNPQGGRIRREGAIHVSNVMPVDSQTHEPTRVSKREQDGRRIRVGRRSGEPIDAAAAGRKGGAKATRAEASSKKSSPAKKKGED